MVFKFLLLLIALYSACGEPPFPVQPVDRILFSLDTITQPTDGLVPVIVQDSDSKDILTLAYTNKESLELTKKTGNSWFWSRSRKKLWMKGEESGNTQKVKKILVDCDADAIIYLVEPSGPACHLGEQTCFHNDM